MKYLIALLTLVSTTAWADNPLVVRSIQRGHTIIACVPSVKTDGACNTTHRDLYPAEYAKSLGYSTISEQFVVVTNIGKGWIILMDVTK